MIKEVDIAKPVEIFFEELGYRVRSEVKGCDITATKGDELVIIECKTSVSLKLIYQSIDRQEFSDSVYVAIPVFPGKSIPNRKHFTKLLKRLEIGLITVTMLKKGPRVEVQFDPAEYKLKNRKKHRGSVIKEINNRSYNMNTGGSVGKKLMTAYRELSINIAEILKESGPLSAKELRKMGMPDKTYSILYKNYYGWFVKSEGHGKYALTQRGIDALTNDPT